MSGSGDPRIHQTIIFMAIVVVLLALFLVGVSIFGLPPVS